MTTRLANHERRDRLSTVHGSDVEKLLFTVFAPLLGRGGLRLGSRTTLAARLVGRAREDEEHENDDAARHYPMLLDQRKDGPADLHQVAEQ